MIGCNIFFIIFVFIAFTITYFEGTRSIIDMETKVEEISEVMSNETDIEKLKRFTVLEMNSRKSLFQFAASTERLLNSTLIMFFFVLIFNASYLTYLLTNNKSNKSINRTENTSVLN